jgi:hypothetical protein
MLASSKRADNGEVPINLEFIAFTFAPPNDKQDSSHNQDHLHQVSSRRYPAAEDIKTPISCDIDATHALHLSLQRDESVRSTSARGGGMSRVKIARGLAGPSERFEKLKVVQGEQTPNMTLVSLGFHCS